MGTIAHYAVSMNNKFEGKTNNPDLVKGTSHSALNYKSYLVRLWRDHEDEPWHASITHIHTEETHTFINVQALFMYLYDQTTVVEPGA